MYELLTAICLTITGKPTFIMANILNILLSAFKGKIRKRELV